MPLAAPVTTATRPRSSIPGPYRRRIRGRAISADAGRSSRRTRSAGGGHHRVLDDLAAVGTPRQRHQDRDVDAGRGVGAHRVEDVVGVAHHVDRVDHPVADGGDGSGSVARGVALAHLHHLVGEPCPLEVPGVGVDDGVGEQVAASQLDAVLALAHAGVDVGVDLGVAALADLLDRPRHVRGRQVVEEDAVGDLTAHPEHRRVEGPDHDLRLALAEPDAEAEPLDRVEVAVEVDLLAAQALLHERHVLADPRHRPIAVGRAVPPLGHHRRGDADADEPRADRRPRRGRKPRPVPHRQGARSGQAPERRPASALPRRRQRKRAAADRLRCLELRRGRNRRRRAAGSRPSGWDEAEAGEAARRGLGRDDPLRARAQARARPQRHPRARRRRSGHAARRRSAPGGDGSRVRGHEQPSRPALRLRLRP